MTPTPRDTDGGVLRESMPAYVRVVMSDLPGCDCY